MYWLLLIPAVVILFIIMIFIIDPKPKRAYEKSLKEETIEFLQKTWTGFLHLIVICLTIATIIAPIFLICYGYYILGIIFIVIIASIWIGHDFDD